MAEEEKAEEQAAESAPPSGGGGGGKLTLILTLVNVVVSVGIIALLFMNFKKQQEPTVGDINAEAGAAAEGGEGAEGAAGKVEETVHDFGRMVPLEQFTVNLVTVGTVNPKYARVNISLALPSDDTEAEVNQKMPQVRNTIIDLFNSKRPSDLATPEGRSYLKEEIKNALNSFLLTGKVKGVYFTSFALSS